MFLKVRGNMKHLYALMGGQTRFWIAQIVADTKYTADITPMFREGREIAGTPPTTLITDGAPNFNSAFRHAYWRERKALAIQHVQEIRMDGKVHNNKMERMKGELRDREKVVRGIKKEDSPLITGLQNYHMLDHTWD